MQHKRLLCVEEFFWATKSLLETRLIFHKFASTITGYIFVSFLDLLLVHEVKKTLKRKGLKLERKDVVRDFLAAGEGGVRGEAAHAAAAARWGQRRCSERWGWRCRCRYGSSTVPKQMSVRHGALHGTYSD